MAIQIVLKQTLKKKGLACKDVASKIGVTPQTISHLVSGRAKTVSISMLDEICIAFDCQIPDILVFKD